MEQEKTALYEGGHIDGHRHHHHEHHERIEFMVDREPLTVYSDGDAAELTVREVLDISGNQPAEEYALIEFVHTEGHHGGQESGHEAGHHGGQAVKHEDLNEVLSVRKQARFAALFKGCTPVS